MFPKRKESEIVSAICDYLRVKGHFFWRQNNSGVWDAKRGIFRLNKNTLPGIPDIFAMKKEKVLGVVSRLIGIEVKSEKGSQSAAQKKFQDEFEKHGGLYVLARSVDDLIKAGL